jgi:purple acid phosphatase-like protein/calcineurin-like phosphoesterase family protein
LTTKSPPPVRRRVAPRLGALGAAALALGSVLTGGMMAANATSNVSTGPLDVLLGVGADQSQRIVSWYYPSNVNQSLEFEKNSDLSGSGAFTDAKTTVVATKAANTAADTSATDSDTTGIPGIANQSGYINAHATITGLLPNTAYSYHVGAPDSSNWSATYTFTTPSAAKNFTFDFFGDPQIGSSGHTDDDAAGWAATLAYATGPTQATKPELLVSGGDQIEHANNEYEWSAFADSSDVLKQYPWAATIGNHDVGGKAYEQHNTTPNTLKNADFYPGGNTAANSGGDYWFIYKGVLIIDINSNAYTGGADAEHVNYVRDVIGQVGDEARWTVLVYHHSIYSPADHANDPDNQQRRFDFTKAFSDLGVDLVLQGHDHSYSRSYALLNAGKSAKKANAAEQPDQA